MKVIQLIPKMNVGGVERGVLDLALYFKDSELINYVASGGGRLVEKLKKNGITHYTLNLYKKSLFSLRSVSQLNQIIKLNKIDIIHARSRVPGWIGFISSRQTQTPFLTTAHGIYRSPLASSVMAWGKFVICPSQSVADYMHEKFDVALEKIVVISRWVNLQEFKYLNYSQRQILNTIVAIGRISPIKGYEYLITAFKDVLKNEPQLKLKIAGAPDKSKLDYFRTLKDLTRKYNLTGQVEFVGHASDVNEFLKNARILIAPSVSAESFGRVVVEAFACGVPVVATAVGGFKDIIDHEGNGLLVEPRNSLAISQAILRIIHDQKLANDLSINGRKKVEQRYSMEKTLNQIKTVYQRALQEKRILVIKFSALGDLILTIPTLRAIKEKYPDCQLYFLTLDKYAALLNNCPYIDKLITLDTSYKQFKTILKTSHKLRSLAFDQIIDLQNNRSSHLLAFLSFPLNSVGFSLRGGWLLRKHLPYWRALAPLDSQALLLNAINIPLTNRQLSFWPFESNQFKFLDTNLIGINLMASTRWQSKNWPKKNIQELIGLIQKNMPDFKIVLLGEIHAQTIARDLSKNNPQIINLCGQTKLADLPAIFKQLKLFVTPDTAGLHLAQALKIPTIGLFGPTNPNLHIVKNANLHIIEESKTCRYCYKPKCIKGNNFCLSQISANTVFIEIKKLLNENINAYHPS